MTRFAHFTTNSIGACQTQPNMNIWQNIDFGYSKKSWKLMIIFRIVYFEIK